MTLPPDSKDLYKQSGVDTELADSLVDWLNSEKSEKKNSGGEIVSGIGGFAALFRPNLHGIKDPILVSSTDGVGTKLLLGIEHNQLEDLGLDLVGMCVNDLYTVGARPMFFLDYYATGKILPEQFRSILRGIKRGLSQCDTALLGGETAELPGLYQRGEFDLAGFVVGVVDSNKILGKERVTNGATLYALPSTGFHSNGYSLIRHWLKEKPEQALPELLKRLLVPTKIYGEIPALMEQAGEGTLQALAHITGGGISGNLPRVIPDDHVCVINPKKLPTPKWMKEFIEHNTKSINDVEPVFNMGAGMIAVVNQKSESNFVAAAKSMSLDVTPIGHIEKSKGEARVEYSK